MRDADFSVSQHWQSGSLALDFQVNNGIDNSCDTTSWNPIISYLNPSDSDSDGIPDYLEDLNGDGSPTGDSSSWQQLDTDGDGLSDSDESRFSRSATVAEAGSIRLTPKQ